MHIKFFNYLLLMLCLILLAACSSSDQYQDIREYITQLKNQEQSKQQKITGLKVKIPLATSYQASDLRSPFTVTEITVGKSEVVAKYPLQAYPLNMLRFVGTVIEGETVYAYVMTPDNIIYQVKSGDLIGDHEGRIVNITPKEMKIIEQEIEYGKAAEDHEIVLQLKDEI